MIGGGINGAAIANIAAAHGKKVALLEKGDFAGGTSSKSTKLIHGGLRYLEHLEFDLVRESLKERSIQLKSAPHLVKPLPFIIPVYKTDKRPLWMIRLGVALYDFLSGPYLINRHRSLSRKEIKALVPEIKDEGLRGGVMYYDAQMDDARLCLENVLSAEAGGAHVANYVEVISFLKKRGKVIGVQVRDHLSNAEFELHAKRTICAAGPWSDALLKQDNFYAKPRLRPTKGIHIVYQQKLCDSALLITSHQDNRVFFVIPWLGYSLIGTTDTDYTGRPEDAKADTQDIRYLLEEAGRVFPGVSFHKDGIVMTFAGLRPLVREQGAPSKISRKHVIEKTASGLIFVMGGKYTTYRKIAEDCLRRVMPIKRQEEYPLYGSGAITEKPGEVAARFGLGLEATRHLMEVYGARYQDVLQLISKNPQLAQRLCSCSPAIQAQVVYAIETEMARTADDILFRRLDLGYRLCPTRQCRKIIADLLQKSLVRAHIS